MAILGKIDIAFIRPIAREAIGDLFFSNITEPEIREFILRGIGADRLPTETDFNGLAFQLSMAFIDELRKLGVTETLHIQKVVENQLEKPLLQRLLRRVKDQIYLRKTQPL